MSDWISIKDKPENNLGYILVYCESDFSGPDIFTALAIDVNCMKYTSSNSKITHWTPLPEPPKGDK